MRQSIVLAGLVAVASASPAAELVRRQNIDFAAVDAAPAPQFVGPPVTATSQDIDYNTAAVSASGAAAATAAASAVAKSPEKRSVVEADLTKRTFFCFWPFSCNYGKDKDQGGDKDGHDGGSNGGYNPNPPPATTAKPDPKPTEPAGPPAPQPPYDPAQECAVQPDGMLYML